MNTSTEKPKAGLTAKAVSAAKSTGRRRDLFDANVRGLTLRVTANGSKSWTLVYRIDGVKKRLTIGSAVNIRLKAARKKARAALRKLEEDGIDPATAKSIQRSAPTFADLAEQFKAVKQSKRSWSEDARVLRKILLPAWQRKKLTDITRGDVRSVVGKIVADGHPVMANRVLALVSTMFNFAVKEELLTANPASRLDKQPEETRERILTSDEIRAVWNACEDAKRIRRADEDPPAINPMVGRVLQMILLTGQRGGEVGPMRWADVDLVSRWWTVQRAVAKNKEAHRVPLSPRAIDLLNEARKHGPADNQWVFGGIKGSSVSDRSEKGMLKLQRAGAIKVDDIRRHDLRRTVSTGMAEAGVVPFIIAKVLNHVDRGARALKVYDRYNYDREKVDAVRRWTRALERILASQEPARVVKFAR